MKIDVGARTDVGRVRDNNEDAYRIEPALGLYVISDGMGGEAHGELASNLAVEPSSNIAKPFLKIQRIRITANCAPNFLRAPIAWPVPFF